jgi:hypothetical protein
VLGPPSDRRLVAQARRPPRPTRSKSKEQADEEDHPPDGRVEFEGTPEELRAHGVEPLRFVAPPAGSLAFCSRCLGQIGATGIHTCYLAPWPAFQVFPVLPLSPLGPVSPFGPVTFKAAPSNACAGAGSSWYASDASDRTLLVGPAPGTAFAKS